MQNKANIIELFSSVQGEGPYIGYRQVFIRFSGCNLKCKYCDTDYLEKEFFNLRNKAINNPVSVKKLIQEISPLFEIAHQSISLTGGEPLLSVDFLVNFLPMFRKKFPQVKTYLETNGTLFEELKNIIEYIDIISMDLKLKSSTGKKFPIEEHKKFLETALNSKKNLEIFTKLVFTDKITDDEIWQVSELLKSFSVKIPLIIQPITINNKISCENMLIILQKFLENVPDVRLIPQTHKFLGIL